MLVAVTPDNLVTVLVPHCEMSQGHQTALAMMAAEEMDAIGTSCGSREAPPSLCAHAIFCVVRVFDACTLACPTTARIVLRWYGLQVTGGSTAVRGADSMACALRALRPGDADRSRGNAFRRDLSDYWP
jgi:CO/xanthine dehydrogenase Mo-binding subunit